MWLSAIHRDLPKIVNFGIDANGNQSVDPTQVDVGITKFDRMEEGQFVVIDDNDNEFMLFHPEVDTSEIKDGVYLASWQDKETGKWMWAVAEMVSEGCLVISEHHHVEPKPH